jgi:hypothetical protein
VANDAKAEFAEMLVQINCAQLPQPVGQRPIQCVLAKIKLFLLQLGQLEQRDEAAQMETSFAQSADHIFSEDGGQRKGTKIAGKMELQWN